MDFAKNVWFKSYSIIIIVITQAVEPGGREAVALLPLLSEEGALPPSPKSRPNDITNQPDLSLFTIDTPKIQSKAA